VRLPGSKSLTNRALLLAALADGHSTLTGALVDADDAQVMIAALRTLGAGIEITPDVIDSQPTGNATIRVLGVAGRWKIAPGAVVELDLHNAGTATRFLTAAAILQPDNAGGIIIDGNARMRQRPIGELVDAMTAAGLRVEYVGQVGFPPVRIWPVGELQQQTIAFEFGVTASSQFISAVMMLGPSLSNGLTLGLPKQATSVEYVHMTRKLMKRLGVSFRQVGLDGYVGNAHLNMRKPHLPGFPYSVEADASSATYFMAIPVIVPGLRVRLIGEGFRALNRAEWENNLREPRFLQPDFSFCQVVTEFGAKYSVEEHSHHVASSTGRTPLALDIEMRAMPDAAMTAAVLACFANGTTTLRGLRTLRVKETDRIAAMVAELAKVGVAVEPFAYVDAEGQSDEGIRITPPPQSDGTLGIDCSHNAPKVLFETYDDHRMAMSLALIGLRRPNVVIDNPTCVCKTYPTFWRDLARVYG
jgi:3-phosphoshikimate 1-carboxyvinyltransferase